MVSITAARRSHAEDQHARMVKYIVSMAVRAVCIVLAIVTSGPLQWVFVAGAVVLPYVAVLLANAGRERSVDPASFGVPAQPRPALGPAPPRVLPPRLLPPPSAPHAPGPPPPRRPRAGDGGAGRDHGAA